MQLQPLSLETAIVCASVVWLLFAITFLILARTEATRRAALLWGGAFALGALRHAVSLSEVIGQMVGPTAALIAFGATILHAAGAFAATGRPVTLAGFVTLPLLVVLTFHIAIWASLPVILAAMPLSAAVGGYLIAAAWCFGNAARQDGSYAKIALAGIYAVWGMLGVTYPLWSTTNPEILPPATLANMGIGATVGILLVVVVLAESEARKAVIAREADRAKHRLEQLIELTTDWVWEIDDQYRYTFLSDRLSEATGADLGVMIGQRRDEFWANLPESPVWAEYRAHLDARRPFRDLRYAALAGDGRRITLSISGLPVFDPKGRFLGYRGTGRDVTEETVTRALRDAYASRVVNLIGIDFFRALVADLCKILGADMAFVARLSDDGLTARTIAAYRDGGVLENFSFDFKASPANGQPDGKAAILPRNVGLFFPDDTVIRRFRLDAYACVTLVGLGGNALGVLVIGSRSRYRDDETIRTVLDMTAPRAAAELDREIGLRALHESEARFNAVIQNLPLSLAARNLDGRFIFTNRSYEEILGLSAQELLGRTLRDLGERFGPPELIQSVESADRKVAETQSVSTSESRRHDVRFPGETRTLLVTQFPIRDAEGRLVAVGSAATDITERQAMEETIRESEQRFRGVIENLPIAFHVKDRDGRYIMANPAFADLIGVAVDRIVGRTRSELGTEIAEPEFFSAASDFNERVLRSGQILRGEYIEKDPRGSGRMIVVSMTKFPIRDADGQITGVATALDDVTADWQLSREKSAREAEARANEARFRAVIDNMPMGLSIKTLDGRFVAVNGAHQRMMHIPSAESLGRTAGEIAAGRGLPGLYDRFAEADAALLRTGLPEVFEVTLPDPERGFVERTYLISKFPIPDEQGKVVSIGTTITDISEQRKLTSTIASREAELRRILAALDMTREGISVEDQIQTLYRNHAARDLISDATGTLAILRAQGIADALSRSGHWSGEIAVDHSSRGRLDLRIDSVALPDGTVVSILEDVTDEKQRQQETEVLARRLQHSEKMEALGRFAGGIAHDFNNLLGAIVGFAGFIIEDTEPENPVRTYADRILAAGNRAKNVIREILVFSRTDEPSKDRLAVDSLVRETIDLATPNMPPAVKVAYTCPDGELGIEANGDEIGRAIMNLLINAADAMPGQEGTVDVVVRRVNVSADASLESARMSPGLDVAALPEGGWRSVAGQLLPGNYVAVEIRDSGHGMERHVLERIYDPFFTTKPRRKGTGLGLPLVHGIVLAHGGAIVVETVPQRGTVFRLLFPASDAPRDTASTYHEVRPSVSEGHSGRILIVDDDPAFGDLLQTALDRAGFEAAVIDDPTEALSALADDPNAWDLVIVDFEMPGMTGVELISAIGDRLPDIPCILCTGYTGELDQKVLEKAGVRLLHRKPVDVGALIAGIDGLLALRTRR